MSKADQEKKLKQAKHELRLACGSLSVSHSIDLHAAKDVRNKAEIVVNLMESNPPILIEEPWP